MKGARSARSAARRSALFALGHDQDNRDGSRALYWKDPDGTEEPERLVTIEEATELSPYAWSPNGEMLVFQFQTEGTGGNGNIGVLTMNGERDWEPLLQTEAWEHTPTISPDGGWHLGLRRFMSTMASTGALGGRPVRRRFGENSNRYLRVRNVRWKFRVVDGLSTIAERNTRAGGMNSAHTPARIRSEARRFGARCRERFRMSSCCLTKTDSATTDRKPPGPISRAGWRSGAPAG